MIIKKTAKNFQFIVVASILIFISIKFFLFIYAKFFVVDNEHLNITTTSIIISVIVLIGMGIVIGKICSKLAKIKDDNVKYASAGFFSLSFFSGACFKGLCLTSVAFNSIIMIFPLIPVLIGIRVSNLFFSDNSKME